MRYDLNTADIDWIEGTLSNDEESTHAELQAYFQSNGLTAEELTVPGSLLATSLRLARHAVVIPSIFVFGQLRMKNVASSQDRICEQCWRPSQLKLWAGVCSTRVAAARDGVAVAAIGVIATGWGA